MIKDAPLAYSDEEIRYNLWEAINTIRGLEVWSNSKQLIILQSWMYTPETKVCRYITFNKDGTISGLSGFADNKLHVDYEKTRQWLQECDFVRLTEFSYD